MTTRKLDTAHVTLPGKGMVSVARAFHASRELVWKAYTEPELMQRWLSGPPGWSMPVCEMDLRPGGRYRWRWRSDDEGQEFGFYGEFVEVDRPATIRHTQDYDPGNLGVDMGDATAMLTLRFTERDGITTVTTLIDYGSDEARDAALSTGMTDGMETSYQKLDGVLAEGAAA